MGHILMPLLDPLSVMVLAVVPGIEMRGALLFAQYIKMEVFPAWFFALTGCAVNALLFAYMIPWAIAYARGRERFKPYAEKTKKKIGKGRERMHRFLQRAQSERGRRILGLAFLFALVVIPLPGMGSMTAALLGTLFRISSKDMFWAIFTGNTVVAVCTVLLADVIISVL